VLADAFCKEEVFRYHFSYRNYELQNAFIRVLFPKE
jgi:hypothetical protein